MRDFKGEGYHGRDVIYGGGGGASRFDLGIKHLEGGPPWIYPCMSLPPVPSCSGLVGSHHLALMPHPPFLS